MSEPTSAGTAASAAAGSPSVQEQEHLHRRLSSRQLTMIAIGGAIGVGLFLGSSLTIELAGPGVIITYVLGALIAIVMAYSLAEMAVVHPVAGSFGIYAEKYLSAWAGFTIRATYGLVQIIAIGAEVTAAAIYFAFWFPHVPGWIWVMFVSAGLITLNALQVGNFGELEYWFAFIKVFAIVVFIAVGVLLVTGLGPWREVGLANLTQHGGFLPNGWRGVWMALTLAITSYMGVEVIAVTAGEAQNPSNSIPRAMRTIVYRLIIFYVLAITVMLAMTPWNQTGSSTINGSPFVRAFQAVGIPFAAGIMNLVVITAALSSANTNLYTSTRMLFSLSQGKYAPVWLGRLSHNGVPHRALAISSAGMIAAILLAIFSPKNAFLFLYGTAVAGMFYVWIVILLTHLRFRRAIAPDVLAGLPLKLPAHPWPTLLALTALIAIALSTFWVKGLEYTIQTFAPLLLFMLVVYAIYRPR
ncbi:MAG TPA: amino acid permease [Terriglobales bacterium]|nr:amino acid permease [Terriglobales bacterium]